MHKYREGKMQRTLERELKVPETAVGEAVGLAGLVPRITLGVVEYWGH